MELNSKFLKAIQTVVSEMIKKAGFNKTRTGKIIGFSPIDKHYQVEIDGRIYSNVPCFGNGVFDVGDITKVYIPNNQTSQMYVLNFTSSGSGGTSNYNELTNLPSVNSVTLKGNKTLEDLGITNTEYTFQEQKSDTDFKIVITEKGAQKEPYTITISGADGISAGLLTNALFTKLQGIEASADVNIIEGIELNSIAQSPSNKTINLVIDKNTVGLNNVDNYKQYSENNPPPYPVKSVNSKTGEVTIKEMTDAEKAKLKGIEDNAEVNNIHTVTVNNEVINPVDKNIDILIDKSTVGLSNVENVKQYSLSNPPPYPVTSVNGKTGAVTIQALSDEDKNKLNGIQANAEVNKIDTIKLNNVALGIADKIVDIIINKQTVGLDKVDNIRQYSETNPPPYPVTKVNNKTGDITILEMTQQEKDKLQGIEDNAQVNVLDVIKLNGTAINIKNKTADITVSKSTVGLSNVDDIKQYSAENEPPYPVTSVNGQTGEITVAEMTQDEKSKLQGIEDGAEVNNIHTITVNNEVIDPIAYNIDIFIDKKTVGLNNVDNVRQYSAENPPPYPVTKVNNKTGNITLNATDVSAVAQSDVIQNLNDSTTQVPSAKTVKDALAGIGGVDPYPIGSVYFSVINESPSKYFKGEWKEINNTFLLVQGTEPNLDIYCWRRIS